MWAVCTFFSLSFLSLSLLFFLCCSHCLSFAEDLSFCAFPSLRLCLVSFSRALILTPVHDVSLPSLSPKRFSLRWLVSSLIPLHLILTCYIPSVASLRLYLCLSLMLSSPSLCSVFLSLFFYLGAHSSPPTLEILTKWFQVSGPRASPSWQHSNIHMYGYTHKKDVRKHVLASFWASQDGASKVNKRQRNGRSLCCMCKWSHLFISSSIFQRCAFIFSDYKDLPNSYWVCS